MVNTHASEILDIGHICMDEEQNFYYLKVIRTNSTKHLQNSNTET